jgi:surface protein
MSTKLSQKLERINASMARIREKTNLPNAVIEDVATAVEQLGTSGGETTKTNIYKVATIEERDAITDMVEDDMCVVHTSSIANMQVTDSVTAITFPATVVLPEAITDYLFTSLQDADRTTDVMVDASNTSCRISVMTASDYLDIRYTSTDGITYTRTDTNAETIEFSSPVSCARVEEWNDLLGYFLQVGGATFEGLFQYKNNGWQYANIGLSIQPNDLLKDSVVYTSTGLVTGNLASDITKDTLLKANAVLNDINKIPVKSCSNLFYQTDAESYYIVQALDLNAITNMKGMFDNCKSAKVIPFFDTSNVTNIESMFYGCTSLETLPLLNFGKVTNMKNAFSYCKSLKEMPLFDTSSATEFFSAVQNCESLTTFPLWDLSNASSLMSMFSGCTNLRSVPKFNLSKASSLGFMFSNCKSLTSLPSFNLSSAGSLESFVSGCTSLVDFPLYTCTGLVNMGNMVKNCPNLSDQSLNNVLTIAKNNTSGINSSARTTTKLGLNATQKERIKSLSAYSSFISAGWKNE